eukprot:6723753-Pyramimonas_sp.AAC.1
MHFPQKYFPDDAHERCNGRIALAVTRLWPAPKSRAEYVSHFTSKEDLIEAIVASRCVKDY